MSATATNLLKERILALFEPGGLLSQKLKGFEVRHAQAEMLSDILEAYQEEKISLVEAGTGTGKSLAYLLPALFWALERGEPTVVSTNTIALQEQLVKKDLPFLLEALDLNLKAVLVKGMNNYICKRKLADVSFEKNFLTQKEQEEIEKIETWEPQTACGSRSDLSFTPSHETWEKISAESESCTHAKCPHYKECFFFKARKEAADAHLLVTNHHLLFADLAVRAQNENYKDPCILPAYNRLILDEAHHAEEVATEHFAKKVSRFSMFRLINRLLSERTGGKLKALWQKLDASFPETKRDEKITLLFNRLELDFPHDRKKLMDLTDHLFKALLEFSEMLGSEEKVRLRDEGMKHLFWTEHVQPRSKELVEEGRRWCASIASLLTTIEGIESIKDKCEGVIADILGILDRLELSFGVLLDFVFSPETEESVRWIEISAKQNVHLITARLDIAHLLSTSIFEKLATVVLCSATLATRKEFKFIRTNLGILQASEHLYESPFDFGAQARLLVPLDMPHPDHATFPNRAAEMIFKAIEASGGGVFVLFTSYAMLMSARKEIGQMLKERGFRLLCQGDESTSALLHVFRSKERCVLFGTDSFWEGVDVAGEALRCVIIAKLPFLVPSDPLFQAKSEKMTKEGRSPFFEYSLPSAAMKFKQGFGRLIRSKTDHGCVLCLDSRLATKGYGKVFLGTLPPCPNHFGKSEEVIGLMQEFYKTKNAPRL